MFTRDFGSSGTAAERTGRAPSSVCARFIKKNTARAVVGSGSGDDVNSRRTVTTVTARYLTRDVNEKLAASHNNYRVEYIEVKNMNRE